MMRPRLLAVTLALTFATATAAPAFAAESSGSSLNSFTGSLPSGSSTGTKTQPNGIPEGLVVTLVGDILGRGISDEVGFLIGDLGIMTNIGEDGEFAIIFGDSWRGPGFGQGEWMSPVGVVAKLNDKGRIEIIRPLNEGDRVEQLLDYAHTDGLTLIPSDVINIDGTLYMQGMWNRGIGNVLATEVWKSTDNGATWTSMGRRAATDQKGLANLITWDMGPDGYVYQMSSEFKRNDKVILARFRPEDIAKPSAHEYYALQKDGSGVWGKTPTPILSDNVRAGEMSLRYIEGHWVLAMFNAHTYSVEIRISQNITRNWNEVTPAKVVLGGNWALRQSPENFAQLYGAYIVPGSTLDNMNLVVSQWNTSNNSRYMSSQFNIRGLKEFFGIGSTNPMARSFQQDTPSGRTGDQSVVTATETPVSPEAEQQLRAEREVATAANFAVVPLK